MSGRIVHIASNTFREAVRDRMLYNLIARMVSSSSNHPNVLSVNRRRKLSAPQYAMSLKLISFKLPVDGGAMLVFRS